MQPTEPGKTEKATGYVTEYVTEKAEKKTGTQPEKQPGTPGKESGTQPEKETGDQHPDKNRFKEVIL